MTILHSACETDSNERRLDPMSDNSNDDSATGHVGFAVNTMVINVTESGGTNSSTAGVSAKRRLVEKILQSSSTRTDAEDHDLDVEISSYLNCKPSPAEADDAMLFWRQHGSDHPRLQRLAMRYLTISAPSVPVESMFSTTGLILNSKRSSLAPHKLNYCAFIHDNSR